MDKNFVKILIKICKFAETELTDLLNKEEEERKKNDICYRLEGEHENHTKCHHLRNHGQAI